MILGGCSDLQLWATAVLSGKENYFSEWVIYFQTGQVDTRWTRNSWLDGAKLVRQQNEGVLGETQC